MSRVLLHPAWCDRWRCQANDDEAWHLSGPIRTVEPTDDDAEEERASVALERCDERDPSGVWLRGEVRARVAFEDVVDGTVLEVPVVRWGPAMLWRLVTTVVEVIAVVEAADAELDATPLTAARTG